MPKLINQCFAFFHSHLCCKVIEFNVSIFDFAVSRQLEKLSDLFEKLRVSRIFSDKARRLCKYLPWFCKPFFCLCAPAEGRGKGGVGPGAQTHRVAEVLHERHPSCQGETQQQAARGRLASVHATTTFSNVTLVKWPEDFRWCSNPLITNKSRPVQ